MGCPAALDLPLERMGLRVVVSSPAPCTAGGRSALAQTQRTQQRWTRTWCWAIAVTRCMQEMGEVESSKRKALGYRP